MQNVLNVLIMCLYIFCICAQRALSIQSYIEFLPYLYPKLICMQIVIANKCM